MAVISLPNIAELALTSSPITLEIPVTPLMRETTEIAAGLEILPLSLPVGSIIIYKNAYDEPESLEYMGVNTDGLLVFEVTGEIPGSIDQVKLTPEYLQSLIPRFYTIQSGISGEYVYCNPAEERISEQGGRGILDFQIQDGPNSSRPALVNVDWDWYTNNSRRDALVIKAHGQIISLKANEEIVLSHGVSIKYICRYFDEGPHSPSIIKVEVTLASGESYTRGITMNDLRTLLSTFALKEA